MPRIPVLTASTTPGILQLPRPQPEHFGAEGWRGLARFGEVLGRLAEQEEDREATQLEVELGVGVQEIRLRYAQVAEPDQYEALVEKDLTQLQKTLLKRAPSPRAERILGNRFGLRLREEQVNTGHEVLKRKGELEIAGLHDSLEAIAQRLPDVPGTSARQELLAHGQDLITRAERRRIINPVVAQRARAAFEEKVADADALTDIRLDPFQAHRDLTAGEYAALDPVKRERLVREAESRIVWLDNLRRSQIADEERLEKKGWREKSQEFLRRSIAGEDVSAALLDHAKDLGDQFDNTFNAVRAINAARAKGELVASTPSVVQSFDRRLRGVGDPLTRQEVVAAADAGTLNGADTTRLLTGIEQREKEDTGPASRNAALTDAEQFIRRGLQIKVLGVDRMTGADNERQNTAINLATIEFYDLESQARAGAQPFDARRVAQTLVEKWRGFLVPEAVQEGMIFGAKTFEDAELEIARRVRAGRLEPDQARFLLRVAEQMLPRAPKPVQPSQPTEITAPITP